MPLSGLRNTRSSPYMLQKVRIRELSTSDYQDLTSPLLQDLSPVRIESVKQRAS
jgi:hypothetical protein